MTRLSDLYVRAKSLHGQATEIARRAVALLREFDAIHVPPPAEVCDALVGAMAFRRAFAAAARLVFAESYDQEIGS